MERFEAFGLHFAVVAVSLSRHEGTRGLGAVVPERLGAFWSRGGPLGSSRGNTWPRGRSSRSVLERFGTFGRHFRSWRSAWVATKEHLASGAGVPERFGAFGLHFRSWRSRDRRSHQGPAAQHIESRGPAPAGPCGAPAGAGALRFADRRPRVLTTISLAVSYHPPSGPDCSPSGSQ